MTRCCAQPHGSLSLFSCNRCDSLRSTRIDLEPPAAQPHQLRTRRLSLAIAPTCRCLPLSIAFLLDAARRTHLASRTGDGLPASSHGVCWRCSRLSWRLQSPPRCLAILPSAGFAPSTQFNTKVLQKSATSPVDSSNRAAVLAMHGIVRGGHSGFASMALSSASLATRRTPRPRASRSSTPAPVPTLPTSTRPSPPTMTRCSRAIRRTGLPDSPDAAALSRLALNPAAAHARPCTLPSDTHRAAELPHPQPARLPSMAHRADPRAAQRRKSSANAEPAQRRSDRGPRSRRRVQHRHPLRATRPTRPQAMRSLCWRLFLGFSLCAQSLRRRKHSRRSQSIRLASSLPYPAMCGVCFASSDFPSDTKLFVCGRVASSRSPASMIGSTSRAAPARRAPRARVSRETTSGFQAKARLRPARTREPAPPAA